MPTKSTYNRVSEGSASLPSLLVNLMKYAQRHPKNTFVRRGLEPYSLWRDGPFPAVLSKNRFEALSAELHTLGTPQQSVSSSSIDDDDHLYDGGWDEAN